MASKDSTPANTISSRGNGCISFDECMDIFKRGGACQMQYNGQWIPFDPNVVIRDFRIAPQLTQKDGAKIVRYALYRLGEILDQMCSGMYFALPNKGPKENWRHTYPMPKDENLACFASRKKDIFKSYFRIVESEYKNELVVGNGVVGMPQYCIQCRSLEANSWETLFVVRYMTYTGYEKYYARSCASWEGEYMTDWGIIMLSGLRGKMVDTSKNGRPNWEKDLSAYTRLDYTDSCKDVKSVIITQQRISTLDPSIKPGEDVLHNIAVIVWHFLKQVSDLDMKFENFKGFINKQLEETLSSSYRIDNSPTYSVVTIKETIFNSVREYMQALLGKYQHGDQYQDYVFAKAILLRYFNDKYNDTIDEVRYQRSI